MITDYKSIDGWFDYQDVYDQEIEKLLSRFNRKLVIVEVGAWLGRSSFYLVNSRQDKAEIFIVDTWQGSPDEMETTHALANQRDIFIDFMKNMKIHSGKFIPFRSLSTDAANFFDDHSVDFIFLDGDHSFDGVKADLAAWLPKLSDGGILAGHDYTKSFPGVKQAVNEAFGTGNFKVNGRSWIYDTAAINAAIKQTLT